MITKIISDEYICYGGDFDRTLYLQSKIGKRNSNLNLCLTGDNHTVCHHLTSIEPDYSLWLLEHSKELLTVSIDDWYVSKLGRPKNDLYNEFQYVLGKLHKLIKL